MRQHKDVHVFAYVRHQESCSGVLPKGIVAIQKSPNAYTLRLCNLLS